MLDLEGRVTRQDLIDHLVAHVKTVVTEMVGHNINWLLVNEPVDASGQLVSSIWSRVIGPDYIVEAFRAARDADETAKLSVPPVSPPLIFDVSLCR